MGIVATIGFFDGVHRGHQWLISQVIEESRCRDARSLLITFDRHPRTVFAPTTVPPSLTTAKEKMRLLRATGVDDTYVLPFDAQMASLTAREFMREVLHEQLHVTTLVVGYDHRFGRPEPLPDGLRPIDLYRRYGSEVGIEVVEAKPLEGEHVSSSAIRKALGEGDVATANRLLGRPYTWRGTVVHGHALGRQLGFPTANLDAEDAAQMLPANGCYAVRLGGRAAMLNIGVRPTVAEGEQCSVEAHVLDYDGNLYGSVQQLTFIERLRPEQKFASRAALIWQLGRDELRTRQLLCPPPTLWQRVKEWPWTYLLIFFLTQVSALPLSLLLQLVPTTASLAMDTRMSVMLAAANILAISCFLLCHPRKVTWQHVVGGLQKGRRLATLRVVLMALPAIAFVNILQELLLPDLPSMIDDAMLLKIMGSTLGLATMCLIGPMAEELLFRGGIQATLRWHPIVVSAAVFALIHMNPPQMPAAFCIGLVLAWAHVETASLAACIAIHVLNNTLAVVLTQLTPTDSSLVSLLGGRTEAWAVVGTCAAVMVACGVWLWRRDRAKVA